MTNTTPQNLENIAETIFDISKKLTPIERINSDSANPTTKPHLLSVPDGRKVVDATEMHIKALEYLRPIRRKGTANLADLESLISWSNRFKGESSALFASPDMKSPKLTCIADYHAQGAPDPISPDGDETARHCHHRAVYSFPLSPEWTAWKEIDGQALGKDQLGEFIEANAKDILDPTPAILSGKSTEATEPWEARMIQTATQIDGRFGQLSQLLQLSRRFQVFETANLTVETNRDTGEASIQFLNEHNDKDGAPLKIPNLIMIAIPVFLGGAPYRMAVRFRYRKAGPDVKFFLSIYNPEKSFEDAFKEACNTAREKTNLPLFIGTPET